MTSMDFTRLKWRQTDFHAFRAAVEKISDQAFLAGLAGNGRDSWVREVAVKKLNDWMLLGELARISNDIHVRRPVM